MATLQGGTFTDDVGTQTIGPNARTRLSVVVRPFPPSDELVFTLKRWAGSAGAVIPKTGQMWPRGGT